MKKKRDRWEKAATWLTPIKGTVSEFDRARDLVKVCEEGFNSIVWDMIVPGFSHACYLTTFDLARFLTEERLNDEMLNTGSDFIMCRMAPNSHV